MTNAKQIKQKYLFLKLTTVTTKCINDNHPIQLIFKTQLFNGKYLKFLLIPSKVSLGSFPFFLVFSQGIKQHEGKRSEGGNHARNKVRGSFTGLRAVQSYRAARSEALLHLVFLMEVFFEKMNNGQTMIIQIRVSGR